MKLISILMPTYNTGQYLAEAIQSILAQTYTNWELILVDDGSVDNTTAVAFSYNDPRIKYHYREHAGISAALNFGLSRCTGDYVARMDADDIMLTDRLHTQLEYMEANPEVGVLGTGMQYFGGDSDHTFATSGVVTKEMMLAGCCLAHPTVMFRGDLARSIVYSLDYPHAEDYHLWLTLLDHDVVIANIPNILLQYRQHPAQMSALYAKQQSESAQRAMQDDQSPQTVHGVLSDVSADTELTVIIPFRNEGDEVEKTVQSLRDTAVCEILLIDDASDDGFDYRSIADRYHCRYHRNRESVGTGPTRNLGVFLCQTPYFVQIDGHMRFYDHRWDKRLLEVLKTNPKALVCSNTIAFTRGQYGAYHNEDGAQGGDQFKTQAALINLSEPGWELTARWNYQPPTQEPIVKVPAVMGAVYAASKEWWAHIRGLHGTIGYGADEPLMSIKTHLAGGEVILMNTWGVGHLFRDKQPYSTQLWQLIYNSLYSILLLCPEREQEYFDNYRKRVGETTFERALQELNANRTAIQAHHALLLKSVFVHSFEEFEQFNNSF